MTALGWGHLMNAPIRTISAVIVLAALTVLAITTGSAATQAPKAKPKPKCLGFKATIVGGKDGGTLFGTDRSDVIVTRAQATIYSRAGDDIICAQGGPTNVTSGSGDDIVAARKDQTLAANLGSGDDIGVGLGAEDFMVGRSGDDNLLGGESDDGLRGGSGDDSLDGGDGTDECDGGGDFDEADDCETVTLIP